MKKVIIINGVARSGKDTFADFFINHAKEKGEIAYRLSTVDRVKDMCSYLFQSDPTDKSNKNRKLWCDFKNMWSNFNDGPFIEITKNIRDSDGDYYLVMCREPGEIQKFKEHYGSDCITIFIRREGLQVPDNTADQNVENYEYDQYIYSKSLEYLDKKSKEFYHKLYGMGIMHPTKAINFWEQPVGRALRQKPRMLTEEEIQDLKDGLKKAYREFEKYDDEITDRSTQNSDKLVHKI